MGPCVRRDDGWDSIFKQPTTVIPGWSEGPDPESRDSGFDASHRPGMTARCESAISPHVLREVLLETSRPPIRGRRECRALDAPAAWRAEKTAAPAVTVTTSTPESPGIPRAMVYSLLRALPGDQDLVDTVTSGITPAGLTPTSRRQDHTTWPSASALFVKSASASTASCPAFVTLRNAPLSGTGWRGYKSDLGTASS
jgi:hypothetical protein